VRIRDVRVEAFALPFRRPLASARGVVARRAGFVVRIVADDGTEGLGEAAPHPHASPTGQASLRAQLLDAAARLRGADLAHADALLDASGAIGGAAAMGLDMALHDVVARLRGVPVAVLLGGACRSLRASALLGGDVVASATAAAVAGFRVAKLKAEPDPDATIATVAKVLRAAPGLALRLDANGAWDVERTTRVLHALDPAHVAWLEQPVPHDHLDALAEVRRRACRLGHRVAADESVRGPDDVRRIAERGAADVVVVKLVQTGGLRRAVATADAARAAGFDVVVTTGLESSLGTAAALHLGCALAARGGSEPLDAGVATADVLAADLADVPIAAAPVMAPPAGAGLGVTLAPPSASAWPDAACGGLA
jgi:o-succinylbenzoate synthase